MAIPNWLQISQRSGSGNKTITITAATLTQLTDRLADITVRTTDSSVTRTLSVRQSAPAPNFTVTPSAIHFPYEGKSIAITVVSDLPWTWTAFPDWVGVQPGYETGGPAGTSIFSLTALRNTTGAQLTGTFNLTAGNITRSISCVQDAQNTPVDYYISFYQSSISFDAEGGTITIPFDTNIQNLSAVDVMIDGSWVSARFSGNTLVIDCEENGGTTSRDLSIEFWYRNEYVGGIEVEQDAPYVPSFSFNKTLLEFPFSGGSGSVYYTTNILSGLSFSADSEWITVATSGVNRISITVESNLDTMREGTVSAYYNGTLLDTIDIYQDEYIPVPTISVIRYKTYDRSLWEPRFELSDSGFFDINNNSLSITSNVYEGEWGELTLSGGLYKIGRYTLQGYLLPDTAAKITAFVFPEGLNEIGDYNFLSDNGHTLTLSFPSSLKIIGDELVYDAKLEALTLPDGLNQIRGWRAFGTPYLNTLNVVENVEIVHSQGQPFSGAPITTVIWPEGIEKVPDKYFSGSRIQNITIPYGVKTIGNRAFYATPLSSVTIPSTVKTIGDSAFSYTSLRNINIPEGITSIGGGAFQSSKLETFIWPSGVTEMPSMVFFDCDNLEMTIPSTVTSIGELAFGTGWQEPNDWEEINIPNSVVSIGRGAFSNRYGTKTVYFNSITPPAIGVYDYADYTFPSLAALIVPDGSVNDYIDAYTNNLQLDDVSYRIYGYSDTYDNVTVENTSPYNIPIHMDNDNYVYHILSFELATGGNVTLPIRKDDNNIVMGGYVEPGRIGSIEILLNGAVIWSGSPTNKNPFSIPVALTDGDTIVIR